MIRFERKNFRIKVILGLVVMLGLVILLYFVYKTQVDKIAALIGNIRVVETESLIKDKYIEEVAGAISQLQTSLNVVGENQMIISDLSSEIRTGKLTPEQAKNKIVTSVRLIDSIIFTSREKIKNLQVLSEERKRQITGLSKTIDALENTIIGMREALEKKDVEITSLKVEITKLTEKVIALTEEVRTKTDLLKDREIALRTAYYIIGKESELYQKKMIKYEGGILGIASTPIVESNLNDSLMTRLDIEQTNTLLVERNIHSIKILTIHDPTSFSMNEDGENATKLVIENPYRFWQRSKYLVVMYY